MNYMDEKILAAKKSQLEEQAAKEAVENQEKELNESIYDDVVHVIGSALHFSETEISELGISIYMPDQFFKFTDDIIHIIYPGAAAPSHVFGGEDINFQMNFNLTTHVVPDDGLENFVNISKQLLEAAGPKVKIIESEVVEKDDYHIGILQFVSMAVDMSVYNFQYYLSMNDKLLIGGITFPAKFRKRIIPLAKEIIMSVEKGC